jgi:hypothetical protein
MSTDEPTPAGLPDAMLYVFEIPHDMPMVAQAQVRAHAKALTEKWARDWQGPGHPPVAICPLPGVKVRAVVPPIPASADNVAGLCVANAELGLLLLDLMARHQRLVAVAKAAQAVQALQTLADAAVPRCHPFGVTAEEIEARLAEALAGLKPGDLDGAPRAARMQPGSEAVVGQAAAETLDALAPVTGCPCEGEADDPGPHAEGCAWRDPAHGGPPFGEHQSASLRSDLSALLNRYSVENGSDTPDFILAAHLLGALELFDRTTARREAWYGRQKRATGGSGEVPEPPCETCGAPMALGHKTSVLRFEWCCTESPITHPSRPAPPDPRMTVDAEPPDELVEATRPPACRHLQVEFPNGMDEKTLGRCLVCGDPVSVVTPGGRPVVAGDRLVHGVVDRVFMAVPGPHDPPPEGEPCWSCGGGDCTMRYRAAVPQSMCPHLHTTRTADGAAEVCTGCGCEVTPT